MALTVIKLQVERELMSILLKLFPKVAEEGTSPDSSYEVSITLIPKSDKDATGKGNYRPIPLMNISAHLNKTLANESNAIVKWGLLQ